MTLIFPVFSFGYPYILSLKITQLLDYTVTLVSGINIFKEENMCFQNETLGAHESLKFSLK